MPGGETGLETIANYAEARDVMPLAWLFASDFYNPTARAAKFDEMSAAGVQGVKVDFWCSDRQEAIAAHQALFVGRRRTSNWWSTCTAAPFRAVGNEPGRTF